MCSKNPFNASNPPALAPIATIRVLEGDFVSSGCRDGDCVVFLLILKQRLLPETLRGYLTTIPKILKNPMLYYNRNPRIKDLRKI